MPLPCQTQYGPSPFAMLRHVTPPLYMSHPSHRVCLIGLWLSLPAPGVLFQVCSFLQHDTAAAAAV